MSKRIGQCAVFAVGAHLFGCASAVPVSLDSKPVETEFAETDQARLALTYEGRGIVTHYIGDGEPTVLIIGGIHGSEPEGLAPALALIEELRAEALSVRVVVVEDMNPDGSVKLSRYNSRGVDLNRNWPASNFSPGLRHGDEPLSEIETTHCFSLIEEIEPDLVIVLHSIHSGPFVNYDGPALPFAEAFALAADVADDARSWRLQADMGYPTPGSIGSFVGENLGIPILTIEFDRGHEEGGATAALLAGVKASVGELVVGR
ncbi:MAG: hypothetical protein Phyf2KO_27460 [Phycisphaerales bacterium]